jgi:hypothetical protein
LSRPSHTFSAAGQRVEQAEVLVDHADAERPRLGRRRDLDALAVPAHLAGVGPDGAVDDLHQRRLAGAVLAEDGVDLPRRDAQADPVVGLHRRVRLADVDELETKHRRVGRSQAPSRS